MQLLALFSYSCIRFKLDSMSVLYLQIVTSREQYVSKVIVLQLRSQHFDYFRVSVRYHKHRVGQSHKSL